MLGALGGWRPEFGDGSVQPQGLAGDAVPAGARGRPSCAATCRLWDWAVRLNYGLSWMPKFLALIPKMCVCVYLHTQMHMHTFIHTCMSVSAALYARQGSPGRHYDKDFPPQSKMAVGRGPLYGYHPRRMALCGLPHKFWGKVAALFQG